MISLEPTGRVRVVHLVLSLGVGGLEMMVLHLARNTDRRRFDTRVLCLREPGLLADQVAETGVAVESLGCPGLPKVRTFCRLVRRLRAIRPQVLHTHNPSPHLLAHSPRGPPAYRSSFIRSTGRTTHTLSGQSPRTGSRLCSPTA